MILFVIFILRSVWINIRKESGKRGERQCTRKAPRKILRGVLKHWEMQFSSWSHWNIRTTDWFRDQPLISWVLLGQKLTRRFYSRRSVETKNHTAGDHIRSANETRPDAVCFVTYASSHVDLTNNSKYDFETKHTPKCV